MVDYPSVPDLMRLPHRAIVAYAARCARRVQPRYALWLLASGPSPDTRAISTVEATIRTAEDFANGIELPVSGYDVPIEAATWAAKQAGEHAAVYAASMAADAANAAAYALRSARAAARYANPTPHETFPAPDTVAIMAAHAAAAAQHSEAPAESAASDYAALSRGEFGSFPELGTPIDASEQGPLGPLWPSNPPEWFKVISHGPVSAK